MAQQRKKVSVLLNNHNYRDFACEAIRSVLDQTLPPDEIIVVDDGRLLTGLVVEETADRLRLLPNLLKPDKVETIEKSSIEARRIAEVSTMPTGLLDTYSVEEIFDLLAFIQSLSPATGSKTLKRQDGNP